jgi:hypothetical protein
MPFSKVYHSYLSAKNFQPDYKVLKNDWFVVSGDKNGRGYYVKCVARNDKLFYMTLEYDQDGCPISDTTFTAMSRSFWGK